MPDLITEYIASKCSKTKNSQTNSQRSVRLWKIISRAQTLGPQVIRTLEVGKETPATTTSPTHSSPTTPTQHMFSLLHIVNIDAPTFSTSSILVHSTSSGPMEQLPRSLLTDNGLIRFTSGDYCLPGDSTDPEWIMLECMAYLLGSCQGAY
jgi:hypothetical protein